MNGARILTLGLSLAIFAGPLHAKCASPMAFVSPSPAVRLPPDPTLYLFVPRWFEVSGLVAADDRDQPLPMDVEPADGTPSYRVFRLKVHTGASSSFVITSANDDLLPHEYSVAPGWTAASSKGLRLLEVEHERHRWTCSYQRTANLKVEDRGPAAYRVEWSDSREEYLDGARRSAVFPPAMDRFFLGWSGQEPGVDVIQLGHVDCLGLTLEFSDAPRYVGVVALYPDGTETISPEEPRRLRISAPRWLESRRGQGSDGP